MRQPAAAGMRGTFVYFLSPSSGRAPAAVSTPGAERTQRTVEAASYIELFLGPIFLTEVNLRTCGWGDGKPLVFFVNNWPLGQF